MRALFVLGRAMFGGFFAYNGVNHFRNQTMMSQYAEAKGVPAAEAAVPATGALLLAGGLSIMAGLKPEQGLPAVVGFLVPFTLPMPKFLGGQGPPQRQNENVNFRKN